MRNQNKIVAIVGMAGSGKTDASDFFIKKGFQFIRFGQITIDEVKKSGLEITPDNERKAREEIRRNEGMDAYAKRLIPKFSEMLKKGDIIADGLYSWSEYKLLRKEYGEKLVVISIYASPKTRYLRLGMRKLDKSDVDCKKRPLTIDEAKKRDYAEIETIEKGGPIAMADYTINNEGTREELGNKLENIYKKICD